MVSGESSCRLVRHCSKFSVAPGALFSPGDKITTDGIVVQSLGTTLGAKITYINYSLIKLLL